MQGFINSRILPSFNGVFCISSEIPEKQVQISGSLNWINSFHLGFKNWVWNSDRFLSEVLFKMLADVVLGFHFENSFLY